MPHSEENGKGGSRSNGWALGRDRLDRERESETEREDRERERVGREMQL